MEPAAQDDREGEGQTPQEPAGPAAQCDLEPLQRRAVDRADHLGDEIVVDEMTVDRSGDGASLGDSQDDQGGRAEPHGPDHGPIPFVGHSNESGVRGGLGAAPNRRGGRGRP